jgi:hypothetical protein
MLIHRLVKQVMDIIFPVIYANRLIILVEKVIKIALIRLVATSF